MEIPNSVEDHRKVSLNGAGKHHEAMFRAKNSKTKFQPTAFHTEEACVPSLWNSVTFRTFRASTFVRIEI